MCFPFADELAEAGGTRSPGRRGRSHAWSRAVVPVAQVAQEGGAWGAFPAGLGAGTPGTPCSVGPRGCSCCSALSVETAAGGFALWLPELTAALQGREDTGHVKARAKPTSAFPFGGRGPVGWSFGVPQEVRDLKKSRGCYPVALERQCGQVAQPLRPPARSSQAESRRGRTAAGDARGVAAAGEAPALAAATATAP